jgi:hypothetical protein
MFYFLIPRFLYLYLYWVFLGFLCVFLGFTSRVEAGIYQCIGPSGIIEYRDRPCQSPLEAQQFVPIQYHRTNEKQLQKQAKELEIMNKGLMRQQKQKTKIKTQAFKKVKAERLKTERLQRKCMKLNEKINNIESQLRTGCTINKANRLREQLEACQVMKEEMCGVYK